MQLLPNELIAKQCVQNLGIERAKRILSAVCKRIERRIVSANNGCFVKCVDNLNVRKSPWEIDLIFNIKMGLQLLDGDCPEKARLRNLARRQARKTQRLLKMME